MSFSLYIHWPFCRQKCSYCDLNSHVRKNILEEEWINALIIEMRYWKRKTNFTSMESIFFGGGTPSLIKPKNIALLIQEAKKLWTSEKIEITLETNPSSLESQSLIEFHDAGINRISFGVQSLDNNILKLLNRTHSSKEAIEFIEKSLQIFNNVSADIMYGLPTQSNHILQKTLDEILKIGVHHISIYELTVQKNTLLHHQIENKELFLPHDDIVTNQYEQILHSCEQNGYKRYEISNFSKKGYESKHNLNYWHSNPFIGIGAGAHSRLNLQSQYIEEIHNSNRKCNLEFEMFNDNINTISLSSKDNTYCAIENKKMPEKWLEAVCNSENGIKNLETINKTTQKQEFIMMGLRLISGIKISDIENRFEKQILTSEKIDNLIKHNYLKIQNNVIKLTNSGIIRHGAICKYLVF